MTEPPHFNCGGFFTEIRTLLSPCDCRFVFRISSLSFSQWLMGIFLLPGMQAHFMICRLAIPSTIFLYSFHHFRTICGALLRILFSVFPPYFPVIVAQRIH